MGSRSARRAFAIVVAGLTAVVGVVVATPTRGAASTPVTAYSYSSAPGDWVGQGQSNTYTSPGTTFAMSGTAGYLRLYMTTSTENWTVTLAAPLGSQLSPGTYTGAQRAAFRTGSAPGIDVYGDGRGCNNDYGSFTINEIGADLSGNVISLDATFSQNCETASAPALTGHLQYQVGIAIPTPPPSYPTSFTFVSGAGDYIGQGATAYYAPPASTVSISGTASYLTVSVTENGEWWYINIAAPVGQVLSAGTYTGAERAPFRSGSAPGLEVYGNGRGCNQVFGSFTVQKILTDPSGNVFALDASFTQNCEFPTAVPLTGAVRYNARPVQPTISLTASPSSATHYQPVTLTATLTAPTTTVSGGSVTFEDGTTALGTVAVDSSGTASLTTSSLAPGGHSIVAQYSGDAGDYPASSSTVSVSVSPQAATSTSLSASATSVRHGTTIKFKTAVTAAGGGIPTGSVDFFDGSTLLATVKLDATGTAAFNKSFSVGSHSVTAVYGGDNSDVGSTSPPVVVTVAK